MRNKSICLKILWGFWGPFRGWDYSIMLPLKNLHGKYFLISSQFFGETTFELEIPADPARFNGVLCQNRDSICKTSSYELTVEFFFLRETLKVGGEGGERLTK